MIKEELEKEATKCMHEIKYWLRVPIKKETEKDGISEILRLTEPREKRIAELTEQNTSLLASVENLNKSVQALGERCLQLQKDKGELIDKVRDLEEKLANADYQLEGRDLEIKELKAQIEEMKCCYNCKHSRTEYEHCKTDKHEKWEIREND